MPGIERVSLIEVSPDEEGSPAEDQITSSEPRGAEVMRRLELVTSSPAETLSESSQFRRTATGRLFFSSETLERADNFRRGLTLARRILRKSTIS